MARLSGVSRKEPSHWLQDRVDEQQDEHGAAEDDHQSRSQRGRVFGERGADAAEDLIGAGHWRHRVTAAAISRWKAHTALSAKRPNPSAHHPHGWVDG